MHTKIVLAGALTLSATACDFDSELAPRVALDVIAGSGDGLWMEKTDLQYEVQLSRCRVAIDTVEFTTDGEQHARSGWNLPGRLYDLAVPTAMAHPGHYAGGEIVGELAGRFVFDWREEGHLLGSATLLQAVYSGANFTFTTARAGDGIPPDDRIIGHTFDIAGQATIDGQTIEFEVLLDQSEGRRVVGLPFDLHVDEDSDQAIALSLYMQDPFEPGTAFDGVDFLAIGDEDGDGIATIAPGTGAYNQLVRNLQVHDHYGVEIR